MAAVAPRNLRRLRACTVCVQPQPSRQPGREAPAPLRLRMPQGVPANGQQQWAEAYNSVGHKPSTCAGSAGVRRARAQSVRVQPRLPLGGSSSSSEGNPDSGRVAPGGRWGEEGPDCNAGLRRPHLSDAQRQAARIKRCLHQKRSFLQNALALQGSKPANARDPRVRASLHTAHPAAALSAPL